MYKVIHTTDTIDTGVYRIYSLYPFTAMLLFMQGSVAGMVMSEVSKDLPQERVNSMVDFFTVMHFLLDN